MSLQLRKAPAVYEFITISSLDDDVLSFLSLIRSLQTLGETGNVWNP